MRYSFHIRARSWRCSALIVLAVYGSLALAACSAGSGARSSATPGQPRSTPIAVRAGDTGLCSVVSPADFARATGERSTEVRPGAGADPLTGLREVYCIYVDASDPQQIIAQGTINYEVASDAQAAVRTFQTVKQAFTGVAQVSAVGDAAFAGSPDGVDTGTGTGLVVVRGPLLLYLSVGGDPPTVTRITRQLAALVLSRVA